MLVYSQLSPYCFTDNSPIICKDVDGRDIVILTAPAKHGEGKHPTGHQAALIGNDKDGWYYYSYDNDKEGVNNDNYTSGVRFNSLEEFANSEHNTFKKDYDDGQGFENSERDANGKIIQRYTLGYQIKTDVETDEKMKNAAGKTFSKPYKLSSHNCTHVVKNALDAGGLKNGEKSIVDVPVPNNPGMTTKGKSQNLLPTTKHNEIVKSNEGTDVNVKLKRTVTTGDRPKQNIEVPDRVKNQQDKLGPNKTPPKI